MSLYKQKLSKVKCSKCAVLIPLKNWREHFQQHKALRILRLENYPQSFLSLTKHYCENLERIEGNDNHVAARSQLIAAYDTLKMLYFKDFQPVEDITSPVSSPSFDRMTEALAPQNYNYCSRDDQDATEAPTPYSYSVTIDQLNEVVFHSEKLVKELKQAFFTAATPTIEEGQVLWGAALFEGLKGSSAARYVSKSFWDHVTGILAGSTNPSHYDIRHALKKSLHQMDVNLKQGVQEMGQNRWSGAMGCVCLLQTVPHTDFGTDDSRASTTLSQSTDVQGNCGMLHIANIGSVSAVISRAGKAKRISYSHVASDSCERTRVLAKGGSISAHGDVNCVTSVTRALGFHGDPALRQCVSQKPYCNSIPLSADDEYIVIGNATFHKYIGPQEACNMCRALLVPSLRKLVHIFTSLPDSIQEEVASEVSTLEAVMSESETQDSSMIPDNESEDNAGEDISWSDMFDDPIETLDETKVCKLLCEAMTSSLVEGAREAGAVGPLGCSVILLPGSLQAARRRLLYEQAIYEMKKRYSNYALSDVSLASFTDQQCTISVSRGAPPSDNLSECYTGSPTSPLSTPTETQVAQYLTLGTDNLVFKDTGVLKFGSPLDPSNYNNLQLEGLKLDICEEKMSKEERRDMIRDMVTSVLQQNSNDMVSNVIQQNTNESESIGKSISIPNKSPLTNVS